MNKLNAFKKANGSICRNIQYIELAVNRMEKCIEGQENNNYLLQVNKDKINLDNIETKNEHKLIYLNNIIVINSVFQDYLKEIIKEINKYAKNIMKQKLENQSHLNYLKRNLKLDIDKEIEICEYYRLIRNKYVHNLEDNVKIPKLLNDMKINTYDSIKFDDFVIFSEATLIVAKTIYNEIKYDYEKILTENIKKFSKYRNNKEKFIRVFTEYIKTEFKEENINYDKLFNYINGS